jgi:hypothetical protein
VRGKDKVIYQHAYKLAAWHGGHLR